MYYVLEVILTEFENHRKGLKRSIWIGQKSADYSNATMWRLVCINTPKMVHHMNRAIKSLSNSHTGKYAFLYLLYVYDCEPMGSLGCRIHNCGQVKLIYLKISNWFQLCLQKSVWSEIHAVSSQQCARS